MSRLLDLSLDEIVRDRSRRRQGIQRKVGGGGGASNNRRTTRSNIVKKRSASGNPDGFWEHDLFSLESDNTGRKTRVLIQTSGHKILVSGLNYEIMSEDLKDIFGEVGPVKAASINFDKTDRSAGTGQVVFSNRADAQAAVDRLNGAEVNGQTIKVRLMANTSPNANNNNNNTTTTNNNNEVPNGQTEIVISRSGDERLVSLSGGIRRQRSSYRSIGRRSFNSRSFRGRRGRGGRGGRRDSNSSSFPKEKKNSQDKRGIRF